MDANMAYAHAEQTLFLHYHVFLVGFPTNIPFKEPSSYGVSVLQKLLGLLEDGLIAFKKMTGDQHHQLEREYFQGFVAPELSVGLLTGNLKGPIAPTQVAGEHSQENERENEEDGTQGPPHKRRRIETTPHDNNQLNNTSTVSPDSIHPDVAPLHRLKSKDPPKLHRNQVSVTAGIDS